MFKLKGLEDTIKRLQFDEDKIKNALEQGGNLILGQARNNVHVQTGELKSSLNMFVTRDENGWVVNVGTDLFYAAYEEFGTGERVKLPPEVSAEYGMQFYVSGKGYQFAHPYLYPAYRQHRQAVVDLIKKSLSL